MKNKSRFIRPYLKPVFLAHGYEVAKSNYLQFVEKKNPVVTVSFEFLPMFNNVLETTITHPKIDDIVRFPALIDGPDVVCWDNGLWMQFDTPEELLGLIEFQKEEFERWIFDFLAERDHVEVFKALNRQREEMIVRYEKSTEGQREQHRNEGRSKRAAIEQRRFLPKKWKIEPHTE